jgi:uncharacterized RDD family membrane protein YckC
MDQPQPVYAGFWMRFLAYIIDGICLTVAFSVISIPLFILFGAGAAMGGSDEMGSGREAIFMALFSTYLLLIFLGAMVAAWLYYALMESSAKQATFGKLALSLRVTDMAGNRLTFGRATGRFFGKFISGAILYIGYFMIGFTQQKQGLHDIMAGTLVVRK